MGNRQPNRRCPLSGRCWLEFGLSHTSELQFHKISIQDKGGLAKILSLLARTRIYINLIIWDDNLNC